MFWNGHKIANIMLFQKQELIGGSIKLMKNIANDTKVFKALKKEGLKERRLKDHCFLEFKIENNFKDRAVNSMKVLNPKLNF